ncbi:hypothetical protein V7T85_09460 [Segatella copri]|uniref:hypothetical protein n=2 Tax=Segatella copri TaxID=165179 RepID=UPI002FF2A5FF
MKKYVKKGVAFIGMRHLFHRNATPKQRNATPFLKKKHYICTMKEILETMPRIELALIIIGMAALMLGIIFGYLFISDIGIHHAVKPLVFPGVSFGSDE